MGLMLGSLIEGREGVSYPFSSYYTLIFRLIHSLFEMKSI